MKKLICALFVGSCLFAHAETKPYVSIYAGGSGLQAADYTHEYMAGSPYSGSFDSEVNGVYGIAVGTSISDWPVRVELEYSWRKNDFEQYAFNGLAPIKDKGGSITAQVIMVNLYYDFTDVDSPVIPYVFVGAGMLRSELTTPNNTGWVQGSDTDTNFAGQIGLGASWALTDHILFDVKGRVIMSEKSEYKKLRTSLDELVYAEVLAGIRLQF